KNTGMPAAVFRERCRPGSERHVEVSRLKQLEVGWHHANDCEWPIVELQDLPDRILPGEPSPREAVAENDDAFCTGPIVSGREVTTVLDGDTEERQQRCRDHLDRHAFRVADPEDGHIRGT